MPNPTRLTALSQADFIRLLTQSGARTLTAETLRADIESGAPVNEDGTLNLIDYAAWLMKETAENAD